MSAAFRYKCVKLALMNQPAEQPADFEKATRDADIIAHYVLDGHVAPTHGEVVLDFQSRLERKGAEMPKS